MHKGFMRKGLLVTALAAAPMLAGCGPALLAGGAGAVGVASVQEGGLSRAGTDLRIQAQINDAWFRYDVDTFAKLDITVNGGRVLLTGVVQNPQHRVEAVRLAWQPKGVVQVINEIRVSEAQGFVGMAKDTWITSRIRAAITLDADVQSINYSIDTVEGVVYLMGYAQDQRELDKALDLARKVSGVQQVVSYVKIAGFDEESGTGEMVQGQEPAPNEKPYAWDTPAGGSEATTQGPVSLTPVDSSEVR